MKKSKHGDIDLALKFLQQPRKWITSEREAIQEYLTARIPDGGIADDEVKGAASYEFARSSASYRYAATMFKKGAEDAICAPFGISAGRPDDFDFLIMQFPWRTIWTCPQFPELPWTKLTESEKKEIQFQFRAWRYTPPEKQTAPTDLKQELKEDSPSLPPPFNALDVESLAVMKVIEKLQSLAEKTKTEREEVSSRKRNIRENPVIAAVRSDQLPWVEHVICTLDYRYGKDALVDAFRARLESTRTKYFDDYYKPPIQRDSELSLRRYREALKNLTAARLYATLGFREAKKWTEQNHKLKNGTHLLYFGQKVRKKLNPGLKYLKKSESGAYKGGALFDERWQWEKAVETSVEALKTPSGFGLMLE